MSENSDEMILEHIKKVHETIALTLGATLSMVLVLFFFTYSALADSNYAAFLWLEAIASILIVVALIYIRDIALYLTKLRFMKRENYQHTLNQLSVSDL